MEAKVYHKQKLRSSETTYHGFERVLVELNDGKPIRRTIAKPLIFGPSKATPEGYCFAEVSDTKKNRIAIKDLVLNGFVFFEDPDIMELVGEIGTGEVVGEWAGEAKVAAEVTMQDDDKKDIKVGMSLSELQEKYEEVWDRDVPNKYKNNAEWLQSKIEEKN